MNNDQLLNKLELLIEEMMSSSLEVYDQVSFSDGDNNDADTEGFTELHS